MNIETFLLSLILAVVVLIAYRQKHGTPNNPQPAIGALKMNYKVKDDNPPVRFNITGGEIKDAEGNVIPTTLETTVTDPNVLGLTLDDDNRSGELSFGSPGVANFNVVEKDSDGNIVASNSDGFTVTTGDPASIAPIVTAFEGITPVDQPTA